MFYDRTLVSGAESPFAILRKLEGNLERAMTSWDWFQLQLIELTCIRMITNFMQSQIHRDLFNQRFAFQSFGTPSRQLQKFVSFLNGGRCFIAQYYCLIRIRTLKSDKTFVNSCQKRDEILTSQINHRNI